MTDVVPSHAKRAADWGDDPPLCSTRCMRLAFLTIDGVPYCIDCAEAWFDRIQAIEIRPELRDVLPAIGKHERVRPSRPQRLTAEEEEEGRRMMDRLGKAWALSPFNPANDPSRRRPDRPPPDNQQQRVTRDQPPERSAVAARPEPAGQISLLADEC